MRPGKKTAHCLAITLMLALLHLTAAHAKLDPVQARLAADIAGGEPVVIHVTVALCDNQHQGIIPVPAELGNGQDPDHNLYWGALYGVRTFMTRTAGWSIVDRSRPADAAVRERMVMHAALPGDPQPAQVYLIADAWNGARIELAISRFLSMAAGQARETVALRHGDREILLQAGGASHLVAYLGHNGLMEFSLDTPSPPGDAPGPRAAMVLACASRSYFLEHLLGAGAHPLLLTTGLMAPEAYALDGAIRAWVETRTTEAVVHGAADAYHRYQRCGRAAARRLFWGQAAPTASSSRP